LRDRRAVLPAADTLDRIGRAARALARRRMEAALLDGLPVERLDNLDRLLAVNPPSGSAASPGSNLRRWRRVRRTCWRGESGCVTATTTESQGYIGQRDDPDTGVNPATGAADPEAGLLYANARCYDPVIGWFISPDWWDPT
jgi:hypothetical protein